jgi:hypothetical protein
VKSSGSTLSGARVISKTNLSSTVSWVNVRDVGSGGTPSCSAQAFRPVGDAPLEDALHQVMTGPWHLRRGPFTFRCSSAWELAGRQAAAPVRSPAGS